MGATVIGPLPVSVDNRSTADLVIYAVRGSLRRRLGSVAGTSRATMTVPDMFTNDLGSFVLRAEQVGAGGNAAYISDPVVVQPGVRLILTLQARLSTSTLIVE